MSTRKVSYRDGSDTRQTDEFDVSLLVARDTLQFGTSHLDIGERYSLTIKYFIILTSCREMFPKPVVEEPQGTFRAVITTSLIPSRPSSTPSSRRMSVERSETELSLSSDRHGGRKVSVEGGSGMPSFDKSTDSRGEFSSLELTDTVSSTLTNSSTHDSDTTKLENSIRLGGIR